jgi:serine/threonine protein kinase
LRQLLLHAGEVVTKDELLESLWGSISVVEGSLTTAISKLRKVLGNGDHIVLTIPRIGYRLDIPVEIERPSPPESAGLNLSPGSPVPGRAQWLLKQRLGLSPSSEVWLAGNPKTEETRVFKFALDEARLKGLKREVTLARLLREELGSRPDFVRMLEWNFDTPPYFVEFEYAGPNLVEWAEAQGGLRALTLELRLRILAQAAATVAAAHGIGILHKDLKPRNILVAGEPGGPPQIKVADFGSASLLEPERLGALGITNLGFTELGHSGKVVTVTALYVAPEVLGGQSPRAAADVYALGVMLYQLTVGDFRKPFAPGWEADIEDPLLREDIAAAASGDPARRLASAGELVRRLTDLDVRRNERQRLERESERRQAAATRKPWLIAAAAALFLVVSVGLFFNWKSRADAAKIKTIAVLPFQDMSRETDTAHLRLALADEVANILNQIRGLSVRPCATTARYDRSGVDLREAGQQMHVDNIVTGRFARSGEQLIINLEAVDVTSNRVVWRDKIDAPAGSMIAAQVQIALRVRGGLAAAFGVTPVGSAPGPKNEEAYDLYLRSAVLEFHPRFSEKALAMVDRALELDPAYSPLWMARAQRYYVEARYGNSPNPAMLERSIAAMERVLALDANHVGAAGGLARIRTEQGDLAKAYERAADLVRRRPDTV